MPATPVVFREHRHRPGMHPLEFRSPYEQAIGFLDGPALGVMGVNIPFGGSIDSLPILAVGFSGFSLVYKDSNGAGGVLCYVIHCDPFDGTPLFDPTLLPINVYEVDGNDTFTDFGANAERWSVSTGTAGLWGDVFHTFILRFVNQSPFGLDDLLIETYLYATAARYDQPFV